MIAPRVGRVCDVLVVGGGPAGSTTALLLARAGWSVTVIERAILPRPKPCGECLNPGAVAALERLDLLGRVLDLAPARLDGWEVRSGGTTARADYPAGGKGLAVGRDRLDAALLQAARDAGAVVEEGTVVRRLGPADCGGRTLEILGPGGKPDTRRASVVVGADGLRSVVARAIGRAPRPGRLRKLSLTARVRGRRLPVRGGLVVVSNQATVGLAPVDHAQTTWNLTVVVDATRWGRTVAAGTLPFLLASAERAGLEWIEGPDVVAGPWASGPFDRPMRHVTADGALLVGDAAGYYDPLTGQGIFRALHSAELAARNLDEALRRSWVSRADLRPYELRSRAAFTPGQAVQRAVEGVMSRSALREPVMHRLAEHPELLCALLGVIGDLSPVRSLVHPRVLLAALGAGKHPVPAV